MAKSQKNFEDKIYYSYDQNTNTLTAAKNNSWLRSYSIYNTISPDLYSFVYEPDWYHDTYLPVRTLKDGCYAAVKLPNGILYKNIKNIIRYLAKIDKNGDKKPKNNIFQQIQLCEEYLKKRTIFYESTDTTKRNRKYRTIKADLETIINVIKEVEGNRIEAEQTISENDTKTSENFKNIQFVGIKNNSVIFHKNLENDNFSVKIMPKINPKSTISVLSQIPELTVLNQFLILKTTEETTFYTCFKNDFLTKMLLENDKKISNYTGEKMTIQALFDFSEDFYNAHKDAKSESKSVCSYTVKNGSKRFVMSYGCKKSCPSEEVFYSCAIIKFCRNCLKKFNLLL